MYRNRRVHAAGLVREGPAAPQAGLHDVLVLSG